GYSHTLVTILFERDVVKWMIKAADAGNEMIGQAYTIADDRRVTQEEYLHTIADFLQVPAVSRRFPYIALYGGGRAAELTLQALGRRKSTPPPVTTYGVTLLAGNQEFSIEKARRELGYEPQFDVI